MKLTVQNGVMSATAETLADMQQLFKLTTSGSAKKPVGRPVGFSPKKGSYKKECPACSRKVKHLALHMKRNHSARPVDATPATEANTW